MGRPYLIMNTNHLLQLLLGISLLGSSVAAVAGSTPLYPGGDNAMKDFIASAIVYPVTALNNGIEGTVLITVEVLADGTLSNPRVERMIDPDLEAEAIRVVMAMPKWVPSDSGTVKISIPVKFSLPE